MNEEEINSYTSVVLSYSTSHFQQKLKLFQVKYCMRWLHITTTQINNGNTNRIVLSETNRITYIIY